VLPPAGLYDLGQESDEVTALVLRPYQFDAVGRYLGGEWVEMAHLDVPDAVTPFPRLRGHVGSISMRYEVSVYRRRDTAAPPR
jgi:hypothetical protein